MSHHLKPTKPLTLAQLAELYQVPTSAVRAWLNYKRAPVPQGGYFTPVQVQRLFERWGPPEAYAQPSLMDNNETPQLPDVPLTTITHPEPTAS